MKIGKHGVLRKSSFSHKLLCIIIAAALVLLLVPAASIKTLAEKANADVAKGQATEEVAATEGETSAAKSETSSSQGNQSDEGVVNEDGQYVSDGADQEANLDQTQQGNVDGNESNEGFYVNVTPESTSGLKIWQIIGGEPQELTSAGFPDITSYEISHNSSFDADVMAITDKSGNVTYLATMSSDKTIKGKFFNDVTKKFLNDGDTGNITTKTDFYTSFTITATPKSTLEGGTISPYDKQTIACGAVYNHEKTADPITFTFHGAQLAKFEAVPDTYYSVDKFIGTYNEGSSEELTSGQAVTKGPVYIQASFKESKEFQIAFNVNKSSMGDVKYYSLTVNTTWTCKVSSNTITFYNGSEKAAENVAIPKGNYKFSHFTYTKDGKITRLTDGEYTDITPLADGVMAYFTDGSYATVTFDKSSIQGDTTKNLQAAGWSAYDISGDKIRYTKVFDKSALISSAVDDFNSVTVDIKKGTSIYKRVKYSGTETTFASNVTLEPVFVNKISLYYEGGAPKDVTALTDRGWEYSESSKAYTQYFETGTEISDIFKNNNYWSDDCEPVKEGFTSSWIPSREGPLENDTGFHAQYSIKQLNIYGNSNPTGAATVSVKSDKINYGDKVDEITDKHITIVSSTSSGTINEVSYEINDRYIFSNWTAIITEGGVKKEVDPTTLTDGIKTDVTFVAHFVAANYATITYDTNTVIGETSKKIEAAGWTVTKDETAGTTTFSKLYKTTEKIADALAAFNGIEGAQFAKENATYQKAIYTGTETTFDKDATFTPVFTFAITRYIEPTGGGTLTWDTGLTPEVENTAFVSATYAVDDTETTHKVKITDATYFDDGQIKDYTSPFYLTASPASTYIFGSWTKFDPKGGTITTNTEFGVTFLKTYTITMNYKEGAPINPDYLASKGWTYDNTNKTATQAFVKGSSIEEIFKSEKYWGENCQPVLEGYNPSWDGKFSGTLDADKTYNAKYDIIKHTITAIADPTAAATMKVTVAEVQYWDKVKVDETNHVIYIMRTIEGVDVPVSQVYYEENTSWHFYTDKNWSAWKSETETIEFSELAQKIAYDVTFKAPFKQSFYNVKFDGSYFEGNGSVGYKEAGSEEVTHTTGFSAQIPENYSWVVSKTYTQEGNADKIAFYNPDKEGEEGLYSSAVIKSTNKDKPNVLLADSDAYVLKVDDWGVLEEGITLYPTVYGDEDTVTVNASVNDGNKGKVACYKGTESLGQKLVAAKPLQYIQNEGVGNYNTLSITDGLGVAFSIVATKTDSSSAFIGWAYKLTSGEGQTWHWLDKESGTLNVAAQVMAVYTTPKTVTFEVNDKNRGTVNYTSIQVPGEGTTYTYKNNTIEFAYSTFGYKKTVTANVNDDPNHIYVFKTWQPESPTTGTITDDTTFTAYFKEDFKVTMNANGGNFGGIPTGWTKGEEAGATTYWKNFEEKTAYATITSEWENFAPTKTGYTFKSWKSEPEETTEGLKVNTRFSAQWEANPYVATFYLNGGTGSSTEEKSDWRYNSEGPVYYKTFHYDDSLETIENDFINNYGPITREGYQPKGEYYTIPECEKFTQHTTFIPKYKYCIEIKKGEHGKVLPTESAISDIDEFDITYVDVTNGKLNLKIVTPSTLEVKEYSFEPQADDGYEFANWTDKEGNVLETGQYFAGNKEITANFKIKKYDITFESVDNVNAVCGHILTYPVEPQQIEHSSTLHVCAGDDKTHVYFTPNGSETSIYDAWAIPTTESAAFTYYFDYWTVQYVGGQEIKVDPNSGQDFEITGPVTIRAYFSADYHRYNVSADYSTGWYQEPEGCETTVEPTSPWNDVPYGSKIVATDHKVTISTPDLQTKVVQCYPGKYSTQTAWYFNYEKMVEGQEYTLTEDSQFVAYLVQGSILSGHVTEKVTGYSLDSVLLTFVYDSESLNTKEKVANTLANANSTQDAAQSLQALQQSNELGSDYVGPIICDNNGYYEFEDPRVQTYTSGTLYTYRSGYEIDSQKVYISQGDVDVPVELQIQSGTVNTIAEGEGHDYFDVTFEGTLTKESGAIHKQEAEIHTTVPGKYTSLLGYEYPGTTFTFNNDSITTNYEVEMVPEEENADVEKYYEHSTTLPIAKEGYEFDHFVLDGQAIEPGTSIEINANKEYNISAVYKLIPNEDVSATGTGSTGDNNWIIFLIVGVVLVAAGVGIGYGLYRKNKADNGKKNKYTPKH